MKDAEFLSYVEGDSYYDDDDTYVTYGVIKGDILEVVVNYGNGDGDFSDPHNAEIRAWRLVPLED